MSRRSALQLGLASIAAAAATAACGTDDTTAAPQSSGSADPGAFPVTIAHVHGETTIPAAPQRIAVVGIGDQDSLLALGVTPVLVPVWSGSTDTGVGQWSRDLVHGNPTPLPDATTDFSIERVAASKPDLIFAVNNAISADRYKQLSSIAPTVLHAAGQTDWALPWQDVTRTVGQSVGKSAQAQDLIAAADRAIAGAARPKFKDKTAVLIIRWKDGKLRAFGPDAARFQVLGGLGFTPPAALADRFAGGKLNTELSAEEFHLLDADVMVFDSWERHRAELENVPAFSSLPVVQQNRLVGLNEVVSDALSMPNPVTIPFVVDDIVAKLDGVVS